MKKSKHFRKDVILARVIAGVILIVLISLIVWAVSTFVKPSEQEDTQHTPSTQNTQNIQNDIPEDPDTEETEDSQQYVEDTQAVLPEEDTESEAEEVVKVYVKTTTQVKLRSEPNTSCATLDRINGGTVVEVLEVLDGWYKVTYNGKEGYVSATYAKIVEE